MKFCPLETVTVPDEPLAVIVAVGAPELGEARETTTVSVTADTPSVQLTVNVVLPPTAGYKGSLGL